MAKSVALALVLVLLATSFVFMPPVSGSTEDTWATKASMSQARFGLGVGVVNGKIYAIGGRVSLNDDPLGINEEYDPITDTRAFKSPMPTPRSDFGIAVYHNKIYTVGGKLKLQPNQDLVGGTYVTTSST